MDRLRACADVVVWGGQDAQGRRGIQHGCERNPWSASACERGLPPHPANAVITKSGDFPEKTAVVRER